MLTVIDGTIRRDAKYHRWVRCRCECGVEKEIREDRLRDGAISCGCKRSRIGRTHGHCRGNGAKSRIYQAWASMLSRCNNPNHQSYMDYGQRGIKVCERWQGADGYPNFLADMGEPTEAQSLDRIDNDGGYTPENCRWATKKEQARNRRDTRCITYNGRTQSLVSWAEECGVNPVTIANRIRRGWPIERAVTAPHQYAEGK